MAFIHDHPQGILLSIYVQPRASRIMIAGTHGNALKIKLTAPPVEGEANKQCLQFLAKRIGLPKSNLEILSGATGRNKQILVRPKSGKPTQNELDFLKAKIESLV